MRTIHPAATAAITLTATDRTAIGHEYDGATLTRTVERRVYLVEERVLVIDDRDEQPTTYRVHSVRANVDDPTDLDVALIRQTRRGADYCNGLGMTESGRCIERFATNGRGFWARLAEVLAAARSALADTDECVRPAVEPVTVRPAGPTAGYAIPAPSDDYASAAGMLPLAGGDGHLF